MWLNCSIWDMQGNETASLSSVVSCSYITICNGVRAASWGPCAGFKGVMHRVTCQEAGGRIFFFYLLLHSVAADCPLRTQRQSLWKGSLNADWVESVAASPDSPWCHCLASTPPPPQSFSVQEGLLGLWETADWTDSSFIRLHDWRGASRNSSAQAAVTVEPN